MVKMYVMFLIHPMQSLASALSSLLSMIECTTKPLHQLSAPSDPPPKKARHM